MQQENKALAQTQNVNFNSSQPMYTNLIQRNSPAAWMNLAVQGSGGTNNFSQQGTDLTKTLAQKVIVNFSPLIKIQNFLAKSGNGQSTAPQNLAQNTIQPTQNFAQTAPMQNLAQTTIGNTEPNTNYGQLSMAPQNLNTGGMNFIH